jgi:hypothetical protein
LITPEPLIATVVAVIAPPNVKVPLLTNNELSVLAGKVTKDVIVMLGVAPLDVSKVETMSPVVPPFSATAALAAVVFKVPMIIDAGELMVAPLATVMISELPMYEPEERLSVSPPKARIPELVSVVTVIPAADTSSVFEDAMVRLEQLRAVLTTVHDVAEALSNWRSA